MAGHLWGRNAAGPCPDCPPGEGHNAGQLSSNQRLAMCLLFIEGYDTAPNPEILANAVTSHKLADPVVAAVLDVYQQ